LEVAHRRLVQSHHIDSITFFWWISAFVCLSGASPIPTFFSVDIIINNPFFVARDHTLQERIVFFAFDELIEDAHAIRQMNFFQLMRYSNIASILYEA